MTHLLSGETEGRFSSEPAVSCFRLRPSRSIRKMCAVSLSPCEKVKTIYCPSGVTANQDPTGVSCLRLLPSTSITQMPGVPVSLALKTILPFGAKANEGEPSNLRSLTCLALIKSGRKESFEFAVANQILY